MKKKDLPILWGEIKEFLTAHTNSDIYNPSFIRLKIFPLFDRRKFDLNLKELVAISERPNLEPVWNISNDNLEKVINGLNSVQQFLTTQTNTIELKIWYNFRFLNTVNSLELPNYECNAHINFIFSKKHTCSPCLIFPFVEPNEEFWRYLDEIKSQLPFDLDEKLLRKVYVKKGYPISLKKIVRPI